MLGQERAAAIQVEIEEFFRRSIELEGGWLLVFHLGCGDLDEDSRFAVVFTPHEVPLQVELAEILSPDR